MDCAEDAAACIAEGMAEGPGRGVNRVYVCRIRIQQGGRRLINDNKCPDHRDLRERRLLRWGTAIGESGDDSATAMQTEPAMYPETEAHPTFPSLQLSLHPCVTDFVEDYRVVR